MTKTPSGGQRQPRWTKVLAMAVSVLVATAVLTLNEGKDLWAGLVAAAAAAFNLFATVQSHVKDVREKPAPPGDGA